MWEPAIYRGTEMQAVSSYEAWRPYKKPYSKIKYNNFNDQKLLYSKRDLSS